MKPEETKPIKDTPNNQSRATIIFNDLISKRKEVMSKLYDSVDYINLNFEYISSNKNVSFYEYMDSKEPFNALKNTQTNVSDARNSQNEILNKLSNIKIGRKNQEQEKIINNLEKFYLSREVVINCFTDFTKIFSDAIYNAKQNEKRKRT